MQLNNYTIKPILKGWQISDENGKPIHYIKHHFGKTRNEAIEKVIEEIMQEKKHFL